MPVDVVNQSLLGLNQGQEAMLPIATIASGNVITPVGPFTILTGNTVVKTITPLVPGMHLIAIQFAGNAGSDATGNILTAFTSVAGQIGLYLFNPYTQKYVPVT